MSRNGVWQMNKLVISYCTRSGSSQGVREFVASNLESIKKKYPNVEVEVKVKANKHPSLVGKYLTGREKVVCVRSHSSSQVEQVIGELRDQWGTKAKTWGSSRVVTKTPSIQGSWNPFLDLGDNASFYTPQKPQSVASKE